MYPNPKRAKKLYSEVVPKTVDDYLSSIEKYQDQEIKDQILNPVWHVHTQTTQSSNAFFNVIKFSWIK